MTNVKGPAAEESFTSRQGLMCLSRSEDQF